ncbi:MAG: hypothetical protein KAS04_04795 [Candidatus Aenigmarchaeota archaeon]|nr:hypothetical protein [Candidatus Aenigmarchaeota archaeon]
MKLLLVLFVAFLVIVPVASACEESSRRVCGSDIGVCQSGRSVCKDGSWGECIDAKIAESYNDVCGNGLDDNCNGETDENCFPWTSLILIGGGVLFIGIGMMYMQHGKGERMVSEGLSRD